MPAYHSAGSVRRPLTALVLLAFAGTFVAGIVPVAAAAETTSTAPIVKFGMESSSVGMQTAAGVKPDYGTFWIGPWTLSSGWAGPDGQLTNMKNAGVMPAVHFYYWGDDISPSCVENGCWSSLHNAQKDRAGWQRLAQQMVDHFDSKMGGAPVLVFLESEFNKGGIERYEPFDGYLADMAAFIHAEYPASTVVLGFGNWGSVHWGNFDRAAAASDMVGIQGMRGSTKQTVDQMYSLYDGLLAGIQSLEQKFPGKAKMITDIAVSSYPEPDYLEVQAGVLGEVFDNLPTLKANGVQAMIYRSWRDSPSMNLANYYGMAERYWGLANSAGAKPSQAVWVEGVKAERAGQTTPPPPPPPPPVATAVSVPAGGLTVQAETFATRSAGGAQADGAADGGRMWNLWSNGAIAQSFATSASHDITVRARGTSAAGVAPHMDVYWGSTKVISAAPKGSYAEYTATVPAGTQDLRIVFTNDLRTSSEDRNLIVDSVRFAAPNRAPAATLAATVDGLTVSLDASGSSDPDGDAIRFAWSFGDGATADGPATATHTYSAAGTYAVTVTVTDGAHADSATEAVTAVQPNRAPTPAFTASADGLTGAFDASASSDADGDTLAYSWSFGDGAAATGQSPTHTYAAGGTYTVTLTASDGEASASATQSVTMVQPNRAPAPAFAASADGLTVSVDGSSSTDADGDGLTYAWSFGDGSTAEGRTASRTFAAAGTYTVTLTVNDGKASASTSRSVTVVQPNRSPVAAFSASVKDLVLVVDGSASSDADRDALTYAWSFGDGRTATGRTATHTYASPGTYAVSLVVSDGKLTGSKATSVNATAAPPFSATITVASGSNQWWQEVKVTASAKVAKVEISANGGPWKAMALKSWGNWASSMYVAKGTPVVFRVTDASGASITTAPQPWLGAAATFTATFSPKAVGNNWWVETAVSSSQSVTKVEASINGGSWVQLQKTNWGTYAKGLNAPDGAQVVFKATGPGGATATSAAVKWT